MSTQIVCDGCGATFRDALHAKAPAIIGDRTDGWCGAELPDAQFHWCRDCAIVAFRAVKASRRKGASGG